MPKDQNWCILINYDVVGTDRSEVERLAELLRSALDETWAIWPRPTGIISHDRPHIALLRYFPASQDPVAMLSETLESLDLYMLRSGETDLRRVIFAGTEITLRPAVDINWAPAVRGTASVSA